MRWVKHLTATRQDDKVAVLIDRLGHHGYGLWWMIIEIVAGSMEKGSDNCSLKYPVSKWAAVLQLHPPNVCRQLAAIAAAGLLTMTSDESGIELSIPNLLKYRDEYATRVGTKSRRSPEQESSSDNRYRDRGKKDTIPDAGGSGVPRQETETPSSKPKLDDDDLDRYEPRERLKELYRRKTRELPAIELLSVIETNLALNNVTMAQFVTEIQEHHINGSWRNAAGLLRDLSKKFRSKTAPTAAPVSIQDQTDAAYQCTACKSRKRGEGMLMRDGALAPCECATPEYIARQRARGVLAA